MEALNWQKVERQYFLGDPPRTCFIEKNPKVSGTPLWPNDPNLSVKKIESHLKKTKEILNQLGGDCFFGHIALNPERKVDATRLKTAAKPKRLETAFVSAFLLPSSSIQQTQVGFYPHKGEIPHLSETVKDLKGIWLLTNLGYFLTEKLIDAHNSRHPKGEQLSNNDNGYLGGFFVRHGNEFIGYPPHFGTCGVGITKEGKPTLVDEVELKGGTVWFDDTKLDWKKEDIGHFLFTPAFSTDTGIGENKVNIVIFNEGTGAYPVPKIAYIKEGAIRQPAAGIVFSLQKPLFKKLKIGTHSKIRFEFEPWFDKKLWDNFDCFYEGLLKLSPKGEPDFVPWLHPNACLTQETYIPNSYRREPRAVLIQTQNYFGAVAFSGRYEYSLGISFQEMGPIIERIVSQCSPKEKIQKMVSLDGGSSAKLCLIVDGNIKPLNWIAPGARNRMGDPNGNTYSALLLKIVN